MSVIFLPPASAASVPDATETTAGKVRLATSAEATAGVNDVAAMTPAKVKAAIDASISGGVTYRGTFDAGSPADLSNAVQGDLYIISGAGTYAGRSWAVGDHLLVNADMGGTFDSAKIDKIDSTDAVTSVAGRTGAVTLTSADIGGLGTAAVLDVGTTALNVVQLDASAKLPAVDGSQLTNLPSAPVTSVAGKTGAVTLTISDITDFEGLYTNIEYINDNVVDIQAGINAAASNAIVWVGPGSYAGSTLTLTDKDMLKLQGEGAQTGAAGIVELTSRGIAISGSSSTRNVVTGFQVEGSFTVTGTQGRHHIRNCQLLSGLAIDAVPNFMVIRDCEITGAVTISAATTGTIYFIGCTFTSATFTNSASASLVIVTQCTGFPAASVASVTPYGTVGLSTGAAVNFNSQIVLPYATSFTGRTGELNNNAGFITSAQAPVQSVAGKTGAVTLSASDISDLATVATTGAYSDLSGLPTLGTAAALDVGTTALKVVQLDASAKLPAVDGSQLTNLPSAPVTSVAGRTGAITLSASDISGLATVATSGAYSDLSGLPTLGTAAALDVGTTALKVVQLDASAKLPAVDGSQLTNLPSAPVTSVAGRTGAVTLSASDISGLATVATSGAYSDLSGLPTLGTAALVDTGTAAGDVVVLEDVGGVVKLPALDASQLTNIAVPLPEVSASSSNSASVAVPSKAESFLLLTPTATATVTLASPTAGTHDGKRVNIKNMSTFSVTINAAATIDGAASLVLDFQYASVTLIAYNGAWFAV